MSKAQGLPINFIVLAAIAILILILVVGFVIGGSSSFGRSISPTVARQNCESSCAKLQNIAAAKDYGTNPDVWTALGYASDKGASSTFCIKQEAQGGVAGGVNCTHSSIGVSCFVTFADGIQKLVKC